MNVNRYANFYADPVKNRNRHSKNKVMHKPMNGLCMYMNLSGRDWTRTNDLSDVNLKKGVV